MSQAERKRKPILILWWVIVIGAFYFLYQDPYFAGKVIGIAGAIGLAVFGIIYAVRSKKLSK